MQALPNVDALDDVILREGAEFARSDMETPETPAPRLTAREYLLLHRERRTALAADLRGPPRPEDPGAVAAMREEASTGLAVAEHEHLVRAARKADGLPENGFRGEPWRRSSAPYDSAPAPHSAKETP
jgi:hypothetical protein